MLGCFWEGEGSAKNICIRKIRIQKISIKNNNSKEKKISPSKNHKSLSIK